VNKLVPIVVLVAVISLSGAILSAGEGKSSGSHVASVAGQPISIEHFDEEMRLRGGDTRRGQYATVEQRRELLDFMIRRQVLILAAQAAGYDRDPEVVATMERVMVARLQEDGISRALDGVTVSDEEIVRFYREHSDAYARPERRQAALVFIAVSPHVSDEKRAELQRRAEEALEETSALDPGVTHFGDVARRYSDDRGSRYQGGVIGWLVAHGQRSYRWHEDVVQAIYSLNEPGEISPIISTDEGFYLVRLVDRDASRAQPLEGLKDGIRHRLLTEKRRQIKDAFYEGLMTQFEVEVNEEIMATIMPPYASETGDDAMKPPRLPSP